MLSEHRTTNRRNTHLSSSSLSPASASEANISHVRFALRLKRGSSEGSVAVIVVVGVGGGGVGMTKRGRLFVIVDVFTSYPLTTTYWRGSESV